MNSDSAHKAPQETGSWSVVTGVWGGGWRRAAGGSPLQAVECSGNRDRWSLHDPGNVLHAALVHALNGRIVRAANSTQRSCLEKKKVVTPKRGFKWARIGNVL